MNYFTEEIHNWASWSRVFQSIEAFAPLIRTIYRDHNLTAQNISHLTPGTNAVFRVDNTVVKIYAPAESGNTDNDATTEINAMRRAEAAGIKLPNILACGQVKDKYNFSYLIMKYVDGQEAGSLLPQYTESQKQEFVLRLKAIIEKINTPIKADKAIVSLLKQRAITNERWADFPDSFRQQVCSYIRSLAINNLVYVHGDLTGENVLVTNNNDIYIMDFGDAQIAPRAYEYPPIVFELFNADKELVKEYFSHLTCDTYIDSLFDALLLHDFGGNIAKNICSDFEGIATHQLKDLGQLKTVLYKLFK